MISVKRYPLGPLKSNCYVVESGGEVMIIDPGWPEWLDEALKGLKNVKYIIATHGHFDHVAGVAVAKSLTGALYAIHEKDVELSRRARTAALRYVGVEVPEVPNPDFTVKEGDRLELGEVEVRIIETPGHTMGSISLVIPSGIFVGDVFLASQRAISMTSFGAVFTGDTLFKGTIGRVDFAHSSAEMMRESLRKLASLPRETLVYPGHGSPTTIGEEIDNNPYVREALSP